MCRGGTAAIACQAVQIVMSDKEEQFKGFSKLDERQITIWGQNDYMPKKLFEQLIFELHRITVHPFLFARINFRL